MAKSTKICTCVFPFPSSKIPVEADLHAARGDELHDLGTVLHLDIEGDVRITGAEVLQKVLASGMFETILVTVLVSAMCALIRENGGFEALLAFIRRVFKGRVGGRLGVGLLVGAMDISTANNTVAIVMAGPIAKEISEEYGISPKEIGRAHV